MRIGCGGQCPLHGISGSKSIGFVPGKNDLFGINSSVKVAKGKVWGDTAIIYLSPYWSFNGYNNLCPSSSDGCRSTCLVTSGQLKNPAPSQAQLDKTNLYLTDPEVFLRIAHSEILRLTNSKKKNYRQYFDSKKKTGRNFCVRMNGTSDIPWEKKSYTFNGVRYSSIMEAFPLVQFYDYTKIYDRLGKTPKNYHLTFSASEINTDQWHKALERGFQVAMVFGSLAPKTDSETGKYLRPPGVIPKTYQGYKVIDGDETDLTFLQPKGVILGLRSKGKAENDLSGFVKRDFPGSLPANRNPKTNIPNIISKRETTPSDVEIQFPKNKQFMKLKKGSKEAKEYMAYIRSLKTGSSVSGWERGNTRFREEGERKRRGDVSVTRRKKRSAKSSARGSFMKLKTISGHYDTKSHNVNIKMGNIDKTISGMQKQFVALYQNKSHIVHMDVFYASSIQEARKYAQAHKKNTPELRKYKSIKTTVKLKK